MVEFGERNDYGTSVYLTSDPNVANAIRNNKLFKDGLIIDRTPVEEKKEMPALDPKTIQASAPPVPQTKDKKEADLKTFKNFSLAKAYVCKTYNLPKSKIRNPTALFAFTKKQGLTIEINPE